MLYIIIIVVAFEGFPLDIYKRSDKRPAVG